MNGKAIESSDFRYRAKSSQGKGHFNPVDFHGGELRSEVGVSLTLLNFDWLVSGFNAYLLKVMGRIIQIFPITIISYTLSL